MAKTVFITGANRGIGLEFVRQYLNLPHPPLKIFATCRDPIRATELYRLAASNPSIHICELNTTNFNSLPDLTTKIEEIVGEVGLDVIINNAGIYLKTSLLEGSSDDLIENLKVNTVAPLMITRNLFPLLMKARTRNDVCKPIVVNITSKMGSIDDNSSGSQYGYRASKAALNMVTKSMSVDLEKQGIKAVAIHPGWVRTAMGGPDGLLEAEESVRDMIRVIKDVQIGSNKGLFLNYNGAEIKW